MPLKEIVLKEGTYKVVTHVSMCDICNEHKSESYCSLCHKWICKLHNVDLNIEIDDEYIPHICTECYSIKRYEERYADILKRIEEQYRKLLESRNTMIKEWKEKISKGK